MEMRACRNTDQTLSLLGFGTMRLPRVSEHSQEVDYGRAKEMADYALAHGVNYFDTAYGYHAGLAEPFLREALAQYPRESYLPADKLPFWTCRSAGDTGRIFQEQLERCGTEYFDHCLIHNVTGPAIAWIDRLRIYEHLTELEKQGKIRRLGFSFHDVPSALETVPERYDWDFVQIQLNCLDWEEQAAGRQYEILREASSRCTGVLGTEIRCVASQCADGAERYVGAWACGK